MRRGIGGFPFARRAPVLAMILVGIATIRIASTWTVFNHTSDEPAHISCGMEWLSKGVYRYEHQHPPLTRVMVALGPYLAGERSSGHQDMNYDGLVILHKSDRYDLLLSLSRAGNLPFFWLASWMAYLWGLRTLGREGALLSVFIFTATPLVLAHAGLSTTDMGLTAVFAAALYCLVRCAEEPNWRTGALLGLAAGGMVLTKFSAFAYFPAVAAVILAVWWRRNRQPAGELAAAAKRIAAPLALALAAGFLTIWAGYRFSFGSSDWFPFAVPFPELFSGIDQVRKHNSAGHLSYLLGDLSMKGWWLFFPTLIAIKTPIAMLAALGTAMIAPAPKPADDDKPGWPGWLNWAAAGGVLLVALGANINIGLRHILPAYVFLSVSAAAGLAALREKGRKQGWAKASFPGLILWMAATGAAAHPDYLPYFNALAGERPEEIVVDSDLDWGQDMKRLGARLRELNAPYVTFTNHVQANLSAFGFPPRQHSDPGQPAPGWNAVSLTQWKLYRMGLQQNQPEIRVWPELTAPTERVGKTILLYYFSPPPEGTRQPGR